MLMDRFFRKQGMSPSMLSPLHRLAYMGDRGMGALSYLPSEELADEGPRLDLFQLETAALDLYEGRAETVVPQLFHCAGSPGGARPKVLVGLTEENQIYCGPEPLPPGFGAWLVKFSARDDIEDAGRVEFAYAQMAQAAGIGMPRTRLIEGPDGRCYFATERFDRSGDRRVHMQSLAGILGLDYRIPNFDYCDYLKLVMMLTRDKRQTLEGFRRMLFNVFAHNCDDHTKNFAFILPEPESWRISPAYDLVYSPGIEHQMAVLGEGRQPQRSVFMKIAQALSLATTEAEAAIEQVAEAVSAWSTYARSAGVNTRQTHRIEKDLWLPRR